jgi:galactokinase/mevalonate kinase-like predicted kinase
MTTRGRFPFDCIVVTCPDPKAAEAARRGPLQELERSLNSSGTKEGEDAISTNRVVTIVATCDPFGARCGSGGGTLAALEALELELARSMVGDNNDDDSQRDWLATKITLVLHAGGDSSRCPTQMILGKAWASLPIIQQQQHQGLSQSMDLHPHSTLYNNPTVLLIEQLAQLLQQQQPTSRGKTSGAKGTSTWARPGTVVVAATDTLLQLFETTSIAPGGGGVKAPSLAVQDVESSATTIHNIEADYPLNVEAVVQEDLFMDFAVVGVAVPAPLTTAKNHGVYVLENDTIATKSASRSSTSSAVRLVSPLRVLQKPSLDMLRHDDSIHFVLHEDHHHQQQQEEDEEDKKRAWIDTGIIILLPPARQAFRQLAQLGGLLANCTTRGLTRAYEDQQQQQEQDVGTKDTGPNKKAKVEPNGFNDDINGSANANLTKFAQQSALKVDLYTDLLHNFNFGKNPSTCTETASSETTLNFGKNPSTCTETASSETTLNSKFSLQQGLHNALGHLPLQILALPRGKFLHLGTTQEWVDFLVSNAADGFDSDRTTKKDTSSSGFGRARQRLPFELPCVNRHSCWTTTLGDAVVAKDAVLFNSILEPAKSLEVGRGSILEHCLFPSTVTRESDHCYDTIKIGANCLLSGWRPDENVIDLIWNAETAESATTGYGTTHPNVTDIAAPSTPAKLIIPDNLCIQMIALKEPGKLVWMVLGMMDDTKKDPCDTLYNLPLNHVLVTLLGNGDSTNENDSSNSQDSSRTVIWPRNAITRSIWYAKIHPIVQAGTPFEVIFGWLLNRLHMLQQDASTSRDGGETTATTRAPQHKPCDNDEQVKNSLDQWLKLPRVSLHDLHGLADASREWDFRTKLTTYSTTTRRQAFHDDWSVYWGRTDAAVVAQNQGLDTRTVLYDKVESSTIDWTWLLDLSRYDAGHAMRELWMILETLHQVVAKACICRENYPLCGRALMVASALTAEMASIGAATVPNSPTSTLGEAAQATTTPSVLLWTKLKSGMDLFMETMRCSDDDKSEAKEQQSHAWSSILANIEQVIRCDSNRGVVGRIATLSTCSDIYEKLAGCMTEKCVVGGRLRQLHQENTVEATTPKVASPLFNEWVISAAPARVDLSGGWSDTPPICYEFGGSVTGLAVTVDRIKAVSCRCRIVPGQTGLLLRSEARVNSSNGGSTTSSLASVPSSLSPSSYREVLVEYVEALADFRDPVSDCALLKCAMVFLGLVSLQEIQSNVAGKPLQPYINRLCGLPKEHNVRLEVISTSLLPQGSGMGTSSILGGCILAAVCKAIGRVDMEDSEHLTYSVLILEQLLTIGGGFQDQVNGLIGGLKTVSSEAGRLPLEISVERKDISHSVVKELNERLVLAFTGKTRLAKNILQNVLRRWARRTPTIVRTVQELVMCAERAQKALLNGDLGLLGDCMNAYWRQKKIMAGDDSGAEPDVVHEIISGLRVRQAIVGASLCGAGGGGFLVLLGAPGMNKSKIQDIVRNELAPQNPGLALFTWHECHICQEGLTTRVLEGDIAVDTFDIAWLMSPDEL